MERANGTAAAESGLETRRCERAGCDVDFEPAHPDQRFCGVRCVEKDKRPERGFKSKTCSWQECGKTFTPTAPRQRYCTDECRNASDRKKARDSRAAKRGKPQLQSEATAPEPPAGPPGPEAPASPERFDELCWRLVDDPKQPAALRVAALEQLGERHPVAK